MLQARVAVSGLVQGVGYRDWAVKHARRLGVRGWVRNRQDNSVELLIVGEDRLVAEMIEACRKGPPLARVDEIDIDPVDLDVLPEDFRRLPTA